MLADTQDSEICLMALPEGRLIPEGRDDRWGCLRVEARQRGTTTDGSSPDYLSLWSGRGRTPATSGRRNRVASRLRVPPAARRIRRDDDQERYARARRGQPVSTTYERGAANYL